MIRCKLHKDEPNGYIDRHEWATKMLRTHRQMRCKKCRLWHVWKRRK